ncbi:transposase [Sulfitobacter sp. LCG007]
MATDVRGSFLDADHPATVSFFHAGSHFNGHFRGDGAERPLLWQCSTEFLGARGHQGKCRRKETWHDISPAISEAVKKIDAICEIERQINFLYSTSRIAAGHRLVRPLRDELHSWIRVKQGEMSKDNPLANSIACTFGKERWYAFAFVLKDGWIYLTGNAAERALRSVAMGRTSGLFAGSRCGGRIPRCFDVHNV